MGCYSNCGCGPRECRLDLPPEVSVRSVKVEDRWRPRSTLLSWSTVRQNTSATDPHVVLTAAYSEPLVLLQKLETPRFRRSPYATLFAVPLGRWVENGCPNYLDSTHYEKMKPLGTAGLRKLIAADSWYVSGLRLMNIVAFNYEVTAGREIPDPETFERLMETGWDGFTRRHQLEYPKVQLSLWKTLSQQLKWRKPVSSLRVLWDVIFRWTFYSKVLVVETSPATSRLIEMQREKLLSIHRDTDFW